MVLLVVVQGRQRQRRGKWERLQAEILEIIEKFIVKVMLPGKLRIEPQLALWLGRPGLDQTGSRSLLRWTRWPDPRAGTKCIMVFSLFCVFINCVKSPLDCFYRCLKSVVEEGDEKTGDKATDGVVD